MTTEPIRVLLIEDDPDDALLLKECLTEANYLNLTMVHADCLSSGLIQLAKQDVDVVLLDLNLPDSRGLDTLTSVISQASGVPVEVVSGLNDNDTTIEALRQGAQDYLVKGEISSSMLTRVLRYAIERKQTEKMLRESEERHRVLLSSIQSPVLALRRDMTVLYCNEAYAEVVGKPINEIIGQDLLALIPVLRETQSYAAFLHCFEAGDTQIVERQWGEKYFQERVFPTPWGLLVINDDISERVKAAEARLQLIQAKEEFIANVSHDLRTPLFSITGFLDLLCKGKVNDPVVQKEFLTRAAQDVDRLLEMVNEILDIFRLESDRLVLNLEEVDLSAVICEVFESLRERANAREISLKYAQVDPSLIAEADHPRMRRVLLNLVDNAIKFSEAGSSVFVSGELRNGKIIINVVDHGCGIPIEDLSRVFGRFYQVSSSLKKNTNGTGLGLYISKKIVEAHKGSIDVESALGAGSKFIVTIPVNSTLDK